MKPAAFVLAAIATTLAALVAHPASARVEEVSERGIVLRYVATVPVGPEQAWATLVRPAQWWSEDHTYSGDAANLSLDVRPGGCFCEILPNLDSPKAAPRGGVEHMRVIYVEKGRALRMSGGLGPLQADAAVGTLTFQFKPGEAGTQVLVEYVIGGFVRGDLGVLAPAVDKVLAEQVGRYVGKLGGSLAAGFQRDGQGGAADTKGKKVIGR